jgi:hypothetical protein
MMISEQLRPLGPRGRAELALPSWRRLEQRKRLLT